jgi:hypothetical protein
MTENFQVFVEVKQEEFEHCEKDAIFNDGQNSKDYCCLCQEGEKLQKELVEHLQKHQGNYYNLSFLRAF